MINPKIKIFRGANINILESHINSFLEGKVIVDIKANVASSQDSKEYLYIYTVIYCE